MSCLFCHWYLLFPIAIYSFPLLFIISSAPNYCDTMGNKGAFITLTGGKLEPQYTTYEGSLTFPYFSSDLIQNLIFTNNLFQLWPTPMWSRWPTRTPCSACLDSEHSLIYTSPCPPWIQNCEVEQLLNLAILLWGKLAGHLSEYQQLWKTSSTQLYKDCAMPPSPAYQIAKLWQKAF